MVEYTPGSLIVNTFNVSFPGCSQQKEGEDSEPPAEELRSLHGLAEYLDSADI